MSTSCTLYLDGYRTVRQKVLFSPEAVLDIKYALQPLAVGEPHEPRPQAPAAERPPAGLPAPHHVEEQRPSNFGQLAVRVLPSGATVTIDGQDWTSSDGDGPLVIELQEGSNSPICSPSARLPSA